MCRMVDYKDGQNVVDIKMRYSDNLDFDRSLVTLYWGDTPVASKKLSHEFADNDTFSFLIFGGHVLLLHLRQLSGLSGQYPALHPAFVRINFNSPANTFTFRGSYKHIPVHLQPKEKGLDLLYNLYPNSGIFRHNLLHIKDCFNSFHRNLFYIC